MFQHLSKGVQFCGTKTTTCSEVHVDKTPQQARLKGENANKCWNVSVRLKRLLSHVALNKRSVGEYILNVGSIAS